LAIQSLIVLISSFAVGISLGYHYNFAYFDASAASYKRYNLRDNRLASAALAGMFLFSLYPAFRLAKASILKIMT